MGSLGLEGWGRRPQGKGCLLLAVAGTTSLVTLLLAVPLTVLAVLVVAPQKQGLVAETTDPRGPAQAQQRLGPQELPEQDTETVRGALPEKASAAQKGPAAGAALPVPGSSGGPDADEQPERPGRTAPARSPLRSRNSSRAAGRRPRELGG
ncbi:PREDICTED: lymphotoxin-beta [Myotis davidii]|uniref:lymphotoxin-beta n=1 Tax=Myotis davidii TaxID=225400 RepID=UPI000767BB1D|nr:PREDICTED: lymphotoxin-beta [Myotis davidii]